MNAAVSSSRAVTVQDFPTGLGGLAEGSFYGGDEIKMKKQKSAAPAV